MKQEDWKSVPGHEGLYEVSSRGRVASLSRVVIRANGRPYTVPANILLLKNIAVAGVNWGTYVGWSPGDNRRAHAPRARELWAQLMAWWKAGALKPEVHAAFPLEGFREAMAEVRARRSAGRVILTP